LLRRRQRRQSLRLARAVVASFRPGVDHGTSWKGIGRAARTSWQHSATTGGRVRRLWYRSAGLLLARHASRTFGEIDVVRGVRRERKIVAYAILSAIAVAPLAALSPVAAIAVACGIIVVCA